MGMYTLLKRVGRVMITPNGGGRWDTSLGVVTEFIAVGLAVASPFGLRIALDALSAGSPDIKVVITGVGIFVAFWASAAILQAVKMTVTTRLCDSVARFILVQALDSRLPTVATEREGDTGQFQGVFERLPYSLQTIVEGLLWNIVPLVLQVIVTVVVVAAVVSWKYAVLMLAILMVHAVVSYRASEQYERQAMSANMAAADLSGALSDLLRNAQRAVFNGQGAREIERVGQVASDKCDVDVRMSLLLVKACAWQFGMMGVGIAILLVVGALDVAVGSITVGDFVMLQAYVLSFAAPIASYGYVLRQAGIAAANINDALSYMPFDAKVNASAIELVVSTAPAAIQVEELHYSYGAHPAINGVNIEFPAGSFVVIVGPNGSGKSTLARLLAGLLIPERGKVTVGNHVPAEYLGKGSRNILYVPQQVSLFNRTLRENGLYPPTSLQEQELREILSSLLFYDDEREIDLELEVGEQGGRLSGGQVQKLELARVSQIDMPAIILDETTSALDARSEEAMIDLFRKTRKDKSTVVLISHRMYAAENADFVLYMQAGKVAARGPHSELMQQNAEYCEFWLQSENAHDVEAASC